MFFVVLSVASSGLLFILDASRRASEERKLEMIVKKARTRALKAKRLDSASHEGEPE